MPDVPRLTFAYVAFSFIVAWAVNRPSSKNPLAKGLSWIGYYSYSIYLWHVIPMMLLTQFPARWYRFPCYALAAILLGVGMGKLIEFPSLFVRDRFFPSAVQGVTKPTDFQASPVITTNSARIDRSHTEEVLPVVQA